MRRVASRGVSITTLRDRGVNVVDMGGVELVGLQTARSRDKDAGRTARVAVAALFWVFAESDGG